jgi:hypothetical protein
MRSVVLATVLLALLLTAPSLGQQYTPPHDRPGPAAETIRVRAYAEEVAHRSSSVGTWTYTCTA